jgi:hypothetical protein
VRPSRSLRDPGVVPLELLLRVRRAVLRQVLPLVQRAALYRGLRPGLDRLAQPAVAVGDDQHRAGKLELPRLRRQLTITEPPGSALRALTEAPRSRRRRSGGADSGEDPRLSTHVQGREDVRDTGSLPHFRVLFSCSALKPEPNETRARSRRS